MTTNIQLAKEVARHVQLTSVTLQRADIESQLDPMNPPSGIALVQSYRCSHEVRIESDMDWVRVTAEFKFAAKTSEEGALGDDVATLDAAFLLIYSMPSGLNIDSKCFKHFADVNGPYNAWPYWRELVQTATGRVGLSGITVPVFHPPAFEVDSRDKDDPKNPAQSNVAQAVPEKF